MIVRKKKFILSILVVLCLFSQTGYSNGAVIEREAQAIVDRVLADIGLQGRSLIEELNTRAAKGLATTRVASEIEKVWRTRSSSTFGSCLEEAAEHGIMIPQDVFALAQKKLNSPNTFQQFMEAHPKILEELTPQVQNIIGIVGDVAKVVKGKEAELWAWDKRALGELESLLMRVQEVPAAIGEGVKEGVGAAAANEAAANEAMTGAKKSMPSWPEFLKEDAVREAIQADAAIPIAQKTAIFGPIFPNFSTPMETFTKHPLDFLVLLVQHGKFSLQAGEKSFHGHGSFYKFVSQEAGGVELRVSFSSYDGGLTTIIKVELSHSLNEHGQKVLVNHAIFYSDNTIIKWVMEINGKIEKEVPFTDPNF